MPELRPTRWAKPAKLKYSRGGFLLGVVIVFLPGAPGVWARTLPPAPTPQALGWWSREVGVGVAPRFPVGPPWPHLRWRPCPGLSICHSWMTATMDPGRVRTTLARPISSPIVITITSSL